MNEMTKKFKMIHICYNMSINRSGKIYSGFIINGSKGAHKMSSQFSDNFSHLNADCSDI